MASVMGNALVQTLLPSQVAAWLKRQARLEGISQAAWLRRLVLRAWHDRDHT